MADDSYTKDKLERAKSVEASFRVQPGLYLVGSLERGLTVYNQQLRAHNLVWSLWELHDHNRRVTDINISRIAIVGGGITGLTIAACFLSRFEDVLVTVFEQLWDLCPLQQGADNRWLHPRIYEWPASGSRAPGASLPVLNWSEGRASDVARTIVSEFGKFSEKFAGSEEQDRLTVLLGLRHFRINAAKNEIDWVANRAKRFGAFFRSGEAEGDSAIFDIIVLAAGFGLETLSPVYPTNSYWRNEQIGQPILDGTRQNYVVSGFGDGALIDLCRLTIERYRQDTIIYELFPSNLEQIEESLMGARPEVGENVFEFFSTFERDKVFEDAKKELSKRLRKDTRVALHISGKDNEVKTFSHIFGPYSSFLNRMMVFLLYRCGAFSISMTDLATAVRRHGAPGENVLCRYGADPLGHLCAMFSDVDRVEERFKDMRKSQAQKPQQLWEPGTFPHYSMPMKG